MIRVLSLLPAATEIVAALGGASALAGISHECDYPPEITHLPRVSTSLVDANASSADIDAAVRQYAATGVPHFTLDASVIHRLAPNVIITQALCEVCAVSDGDVRDIAQLLSPAPVVVKLGATTLGGVRDDILRVAAAIGREREGAELIGGFDTRLRYVHETLKSARAPRKRVAVIEWLDPLFMAGHWTPEVVRRAGGLDVLAEPGAHSVRVSVEQVRDASPDVVIFAPCGFNIDRAERESRAVLATGDWAWAGDVEAWAIDGNALTSRPGPRLADAVEVMAAIIAPSLFAPARASYARRIALKPT